MAVTFVHAAGPGLLMAHDVGRLARLVVTVKPRLDRR